MYAYKELVRDVLAQGDVRVTRAVDPATGKQLRAAALFGRAINHDLRGGESFPLITEKKVFWRGVVEELLWFLRGETNIASLREKGVNIWNEWAYDPEQAWGGRKTPLYEGEKAGDVGPVYGFQWRKWPAPHPSAIGHEEVMDLAGKVHTDPPDAYFIPTSTRPIDQLARVIDTLRTNPSDRRMLVTAWNPADIDKMGLPPCHYAFQFGVRAGHVRGCNASENGLPGETKFDLLCNCASLTGRPPVRPRLDLLVHMRSADVFLGVPFNIASYGALLMMVAHVVGYEAGILTFTFGDVHLYENHVAQAKELIGRSGRPLPRLSFRRPVASIDDFTFEDFTLDGYDPHPAIKAPVGV